MKRTQFLSVALLLLLANSTHGQGILVYDQQSAEDGFAPAGSRIQFFQPVGQSFTPVATSVGFVQFQFHDSVLNNGLGSTVSVNLRLKSMVGQVIGSSTAVSLPSNFIGTTNFYFPSNIPVLPGQTYLFELVPESGDDTIVGSGPYNYLGGEPFYLGQAVGSDSDLWFRSGFVIPEPTSILLVMLGAGIATVIALRRTKPTTPLR